MAQIRDELAARLSEPLAAAVNGTFNRPVRPERLEMLHRLVGEGLTTGIRAVTHPFQPFVKPDYNARYWAAVGPVAEWSNEHELLSYRLAARYLAYFVSRRLDVWYAEGRMPKEARLTARRALIEAGTRALADYPVGGWELTVRLRQLPTM
ncbi:hypothetical protein F6X40_17175 [Paraburkholderia sp. UCT31]|uniref:hypothetical protein n=1 Tax=Paraburkholderia sp. UCT31 TaxID=2615209 RepID=UPI001654C6A6|nr:hypothetical protein [Paraburkholderia sp. UCT31]MBC8738508.1 hypothetical protein [Paraburkholderia sp. UCT31]